MMSNSNRFSADRDQDQTRGDWEDFVREVKPIAERHKARAPTPERKISAAEMPPHSALPALPELADSKELSDRSNERFIRRGKAKPEGRLDLHGYSFVKAQTALLGFVPAARRRGLGCVLVITGKGRDGAGILRTSLVEMLKTPELGQHISSYAQAHRQHGGAGAFYVFLRSNHST